MPAILGPGSVSLETCAETRKLELRLLHLLQFHEKKQLLTKLSGSRLSRDSDSKGTEREPRRPRCRLWRTDAEPLDLQPGFIPIEEVDTGACPPSHGLGGDVLHLKGFFVCANFSGYCERAHR